MAPRIVGHRGNPATHPENSIAGILDARTFAHMVEIDVRPTADRKLALSHDPTHDGRVLVEHDLDSFGDLDTLHALLDAVGDFPLNIEIKNWPDDPDFDAEFGFALEVGQLARPIDLITCFHWDTADAVRAAGTDAATGLLVDRGGDVAAALERAKAGGHTAIAPHWSLLDDAAAVMAAAGDIAVNVWTVNDDAVAQRLAEAGVTAIITDDPARMRALLDPPSIQNQLAAELRDALKAKDRARLDVIRQITTEVTNAASAKGFTGEVDDDLHQKVISSYVKKMTKARDEYATYGERGEDMVAKLTFEIDYLERWMPQTAGADDAAAIVADAIAELGADDPKMAGRVIGHIMKNHDGLDGGLINTLVREALGA